MVWISTFPFVIFIAHFVKPDTGEMSPKYLEILAALSEPSTWLIYSRSVVVAYLGLQAHPSGRSKQSGQVRYRF